MSEEVLKKWLVYLQKRIILQDIPKREYSLLFSLLMRKYKDVTCIDDVCDIIMYLDDRLPCLPTVTNKVGVNTDKYHPILCKPFYDIQIRFYIMGANSPFVIVNLLEDLEYFHFMDGNLFINLDYLNKKHSTIFPNYIEMTIYVQQGKFDPLTLCKKRHSIGYFIKRKTINLHESEQHPDEQSI